MDHYGGVVVPMGPDGFDELNESAAGLWDAVFGPRRVVEVTNQDVVPVLPKTSLEKRESKFSNKDPNTSRRHKKEDMHCKNE